VLGPDWEVPSEEISRAKGSCASAGSTRYGLVAWDNRYELSLQVASHPSE